VLNRAHTKVIGVALNRSPWPDYGDIRQYLDSLQSTIRLPKARFDVQMPLYTPSVDVMHVGIPTTLPVKGNGMVDADTSIVISRQDKKADEK